MYMAGIQPLLLQRLRVTMTRTVEKSMTGNAMQKILFSANAALRKKYLKNAHACMCILATRVSNTKDVTKYPQNNAILTFRFNPTLYIHIISLTCSGKGNPKKLFPRNRSPIIPNGSTERFCSWSVYHCSDRRRTPANWRDWRYCGAIEKLNKYVCHLVLEHKTHYCH